MIECIYIICTETVCGQGQYSEWQGIKRKGTKIRTHIWTQNIIQTTGEQVQWECAVSLETSPVLCQSLDHHLWPA